MGPWQEWSVKRLRSAREVIERTTRGPEFWVAEETRGLADGLTRDCGSRAIAEHALRAVQWRSEAWWASWPRSRW